jgi:hypothetical protein
MDPQGTSLVQMLAEHYGLPGILIALLLVWIVRQDMAKTKAYQDYAEALKAEQDARIADAQKYMALALDLQSKVIEAVNKLAGIFEALKDRKP